MLQNLNNYYRIVDIRNNYRLLQMPFKICNLDFSLKFEPKVVLQKLNMLQIYFPSVISILVVIPMVVLIVNYFITHFFYKKSFKNIMYNI